MDGLPFGEIVFPVASPRPLAVLVGEMRMQRSVPLRTNGGREWMVIGLRVVANDLDLLFYEPFAG
jgi:hypothetical protein